MVNAPFRVDVSYPTRGLRVGEVIPLHVKVANVYSHCTQRLAVKVGLHELFLVTGVNSAVFEVSPHQEHVVSLALVALDAGYVPLPHVTVQWLSGAGAAGDDGRSRSGAGGGSDGGGSGPAGSGKVLLDLSSSASPRYVFVHPGDRDRD